MLYCVLLRILDNIITLERIPELCDFAALTASIFALYDGIACVCCMKHSHAQSTEVKLILSDNSLVARITTTAPVVLRL